jgi:hypothetical protein
MGTSVPSPAGIDAANERALEDTHNAVEEAIAAAQDSARGRGGSTQDTSVATDDGGEPPTP